MSRSELTRASGAEQRAEEEEEVEEETAEQLDLEVVNDKLECMKRRLLQLRRLLVHDTTEPPQLNQCDLDIELHGSQNLELRDLQRSVARMSTRVAHVVQRCVSGRRKFKELNASVQGQQLQYQRLANKMSLLPQWKERVEHMYAMCIERFMDMNMTCSKFIEFGAYMLKNNADLESNMKNMVPEHCYKGDQRKIALLLANMRRGLQTATGQLFRHANQLDSFLQQTDLRLHTKLAKLPMEGLSKESELSILNMLHELEEEQKKQKQRDDVEDENRKKSLRASRRF